MKIYPFPKNYKNISNEFVITWENKIINAYSCDVSAYPFNRVWNGKQRSVEQSEKASFVTFASDDEVTLNIEVKKEFKNVIVRPLSKNITPIKDSNSVKITFPSSGQYSVEFDGIHNTLTVFINSEEEYDVNVKDPNVMYFPAGVHIFDERIELCDNQTVFVDEGAVVYGSFNATDKKNIRILGYGIIDNGRMKRSDEINGCAIFGDLKNNGVKVAGAGNPIFLNRCENVIIDGVTIVDSSGWCIHADGCKNLLINNIKIIGMWKYNTDGCDICNCKDVILKNSYIRTFDDAVVIKGFKLNNNLPVKNIEVDNCVVWCDWGRGLEIGAETCAPVMEDICFKNCNIIHGMDVMLDIQHGDASNINNVCFENINMEYTGDEKTPIIQETDDAKYIDAHKKHVPAPFYIEAATSMWSIDDKVGNISNVSFKNINIYSEIGIPQGTEILSAEDNSTIENVSFENIFVNGKKCNKNDLGIVAGKNAYSISFK